MKKNLSIILGLLIIFSIQPTNKLNIKGVLADDFEPADEESNSSNILILDANDSGGDITLQFGTTLAEFIKWNSGNISFDISAHTLVLDADNTGAGANVTIVANQGADNDGILRYNATIKKWEISNDGGAFSTIATGTGGAIATDLPVVQVRQAGGYTLSATEWTDITFDTTDLENVPSILEHNNTNTDNIDIKEDGIYMITYNLNLNESTATHIFDSRVRLNDSTVLNGSVNTNSNYQGEYVATSMTFYASLTADDFITLQARRTSANNSTAVANPMMTIVKMEGVKGVDGVDGADGAPGPAGSGSTINIREEGSSIPNTPHSVLNFIGSSVTATDAGSGVANLTFTADFSNESSMRIPQASDVSGNTDEGQISWDTDDDLLQIGTGGGIKTIGGFNNMQAFTSSGTWTKPAGVSTVYVKVWGGGGGGANTANNRSGGGGGGGGFNEGLVSVTGNVTVTVGNGGTAGNAGGNSSFAGVTTLTANGGAGATAATGGAGGTASGGTLNLSGGSGALGRNQDGAGGGNGGGSPFGGAGGGGGVGSNAANPSVNGTDGTAPGGGGGGGSENTGTGGSGANGLVIVYY